MPLPHQVLADPEVARNFRYLDDLLTALPSTQPIAPTLAGSWANYNAADEPAGYLKDASGFVKVLGSVAGGTGTIFTLPEGFRPSKTVSRTCAGDGALAIVTVAATGVVSLVVGTGATYLILGFDFKAA